MPSAGSAPSGASRHLPRFAGEELLRRRPRELDPPPFTGEVARSAGGGNMTKLNTLAVQGDHDVP